jgi:hypothetical protein
LSEYPIFPDHCDTYLCDFVYAADYINIIPVDSYGKGHGIYRTIAQTDQGAVLPVGRYHVSIRPDIACIINIRRRAAGFFAILFTGKYEQAYC